MCNVDQQCRYSATTKFVQRYKQFQVLALKILNLALKLIILYPLRGRAVVGSPVVWGEGMVAGGPGGRLGAAGGQGGRRGAAGGRWGAAGGQEGRRGAAGGQEGRRGAAGGQESRRGAGRVEGCRVERGAAGGQEGSRGAGRGAGYRVERGAAGEGGLCVCVCKH